MLQPPSPDIGITPGCNFGIVSRSQPYQRQSPPPSSSPPSLLHRWGVPNRSFSPSRTRVLTQDPRGERMTRRLRRTRSDHRRPARRPKRRAAREMVDVLHAGGCVDGPIARTWVQAIWALGARSDRSRLTGSRSRRLAPASPSASSSRRPLSAAGSLRRG